MKIKNINGKINPIFKTKVYLFIKFNIVQMFLLKKGKNTKHVYLQKKPRLLQKRLIFIEIILNYMQIMRNFIKMFIFI